MNIGDFAFVEYDNDSVYNGEVVNLRSMEPGDGHETERLLITIKTDKGYRSLYLHKCVSCEVAGQSV